MASLSTRLLKSTRMIFSPKNALLDSYRGSRTLSSGLSFDDLNKNNDTEEHVGPFFDDNEIRTKELHGVDPKKGWNFRGVHKAIICGKVGQPPIQKILRSGRTVTIFTVGTGGMFDQRAVRVEDLPQPAQWHRIVVHDDQLGAYSVQQLGKNSSVYVEGEIETRVYNDSINGQVVNVPEICVRRDGKVRLIKSGEVATAISLDELRDGLF